MTRSEPLRSIGFNEPGDLREGGGDRGGAPRGGRGGEEDAMVREGGRQLCPRPAVPSSVIAAGGWPGAGVWKRWGDRDWEGGKGTATRD